MNEFLKQLHQAYQADPTNPNSGWNRNIYIQAIIHGRLDCLQYACDNNCPGNDFLGSIAAECGQLECIKFLHERGMVRNMDCRYAAYHGHTSCLQYLFEQGYFDKTAGQCAAKNGHLNCLKLAHEHGCNLPNCQQAKGVDCLRFVHEHGGKWPKKGERDDGWEDNTTYQSPVWFCDGDVLSMQYAHENGCPWPHNAFGQLMAGYDNEKRYGNYDEYDACFKYMVEQHCPIDNIGYKDACECFND
jgi:hypothetical protein